MSADEYLPDELDGSGIPASPEAERGVIGCILIAPQEAMDLCARKLPAGADTFWDERNKIIYSALKAMHANGGIDILTLHEHLKDAGTLAAAGNLAYLTALPDAVPSAANLSYYLEIVKTKYVLRTLIQTCSAVISKVHEHEGEVDPLLEGIEKDIRRIVDERSDRAQFKRIKEVHAPFVAWAEDRFNNKGKLCGITSGLADLDRITDGFQAGELCVIGARPGIGKSAIALEIVRAASVESLEPVSSLFISLEMSERSLFRRMVASISRVSMKKMKEGSYTDGDGRSMTTACAKISRSPFWIYEGLKGMSATKAASIIRQSVREHGTKLVVLDYLQKLRADVRHEKRNYEVAETSATLLSIARETGVALICLAQVNRESEKDKDSVPRLGHLSDSSGIEKDADLVILLHRDRSRNTGPADLIVAKQRDGETGVAHTIFFGEFCRFEPAAEAPRQQPLPVDRDEERAPWPD